MLPLRAQTNHLTSQTLVPFCKVKRLDPFLHQHFVTLELPKWL